MTNKPPREGARWGDDPAPEPITTPTPSVPAGYEELCQQYGIENVKRALQVRARIQHEYPHLSIAQGDALIFASDLLENAKNEISRAAQDGRPHTMPETLDIMDKHIGSVLVQNPSWDRIANANVQYGDEEKGNAAKKSNMIYWIAALFILIASLLISIGIFGLEEVLEFFVYIGLFGLFVLFLGFLFDG